MEEFKFTWIILLRNHPTREFREPFGVDTDIFGDIREGLLEYQQPEASKRYILLGIPHFYGFPVCWSCCRTQPDRDFVIRDHQGGMFDMVDMGRCKDGNMICFVEVLSWKHTNETTHTHKMRLRLNQAEYSLSQNFHTVSMCFMVSMPFFRGEYRCQGRRKHRSLGYLVVSGRWAAFATPALKCGCGVTGISIQKKRHHPISKHLHDLYAAYLL